MHDWTYFRLSNNLSFLRFLNLLHHYHNYTPVIELLVYKRLSSPRNILIGYGYGSCRTYNIPCYFSLMVIKHFSGPNHSYTYATHLQVQVLVYKMCQKKSKKYLAIKAIVRFLLSLVYTPIHTHF